MQSGLFRSVGVAGILVVFAGCDLVELATPARFHEDFDYSYPLASGGRLAVENTNGSIEVAAWDQETVRIEGTKFASSKELLDLLEIDVVPAEDFLQIRTVKPSGRWGAAGARYRIHVPAAVAVDPLITTNGSVSVKGVTGPVRARTSNGRVEIEKVAGAVEVRTSNGSITCTEIDGDAKLTTSNGAIRVTGLKGRLRARTSNGSVKARLVPGPGVEPIEVRTSNGSVTLVLERAPASDVIVATSNASITVYAPESLKAQLRLKSTNATVSTDFDVAASGEHSKHRLEGAVNGGGPLVQLTTTNGTIRLLKLKPGDQSAEL